MNPIDTIKTFYHEKRIHGGARHQVHQLTAAFRALSPEQGSALAHYGIGLYDACSDEDRTELCLFLGQLANFVSGAMTEIYPQLLARHIYWPGWIYRDADPATREHILELIEERSAEVSSDLLSCLAWIGDYVVEETFSRWRSAPPPWYPSLHTRHDDYTVQAGWELAGEGSRRNLYWSTSHELIPIDDMSSSAPTGPVTVVASHGEKCGWCGRELVTLFDIDLLDPRFDLIGLVGERLRIVTCNYCVLYYPPIVTDFDIHGRSRWSADNGTQPDDFFAGGEYEPLPRGRLVLGPPRKTPFETLGRYREYGLSQIGGYPEWVQHPRFPSCARCRRKMTFIGQIELYDIVESAEGMISAFVCITCNKTATSYQQT